MPRKSLADVASLKSVTEEFESLSVIRYEQARDAYETQDDETKAVIDRVVATLRQHATGHVNVVVAKRLVPIKVSDETFGFNLLWLAVEIVKDLYFVGIKVANFQWDPSLCISCGARIEKKRGGKRR